MAFTIGKAMIDGNHVLTMVATPNRTWCLGLVRECDISEPPPRWFGRAWNVPERLSMICTLIPLNMLLGWLVLRWSIMRRGVPPVEMAEIETTAFHWAQVAGHAAGKLATYIERAELRRQIVRNYEFRN